MPSHLELERRPIDLGIIGPIVTSTSIADQLATDNRNEDEREKAAKPEAKSTGPITVATFEC